MKSSQNRQILLAVFMFGVSLFSVANATPTKGSPSPMVVGIMTIHFGSVSERDGVTQLQDTTVIKRSSSTVFGWVALLPPGFNPKMCKEVLELPVAPKSQTMKTDDIDYREDGRIAVREAQVATGSAELTKLWGFDPADPLGKYKLSIYFDETLVKEITFSVTE